MNKSNKIIVIIALGVVVLLLLFLGGGFMNGSVMNGGMMRHGTGIGGGVWMLIPTLLTLGFGILIGWFLFAWKK